MSGEPNPVTRSCEGWRFHLPAWIAIGAATVYMVRTGWGRWHDPVIDFGREIYLAWRITQGDVLYRDLATFNGPLSPYVNALWLTIFGQGLHTLMWCNLAVAAAIMAMVYIITLRVAGRAAAVAAALMFALVSAFSQFGYTGNENYLAPYSHEGTHGIALSLAALLCLHRFARCDSRRWLAATGAAAGLVCLTKVEIALAVVGAVGLGWGASAWLRRVGSKRAALEAATLAGGALLPMAVAFALLATAMPAREALLGTLGSLTHIVGSRIAANQYFGAVSGLDDPAGNLGASIRQTAMIAAALLPSLIIALMTHGPARVRRVVCVLVFTSMLAAFWWLSEEIDWPEVGRALTVCTAASVAGWLAWCVRARGAGDASKIAGGVLACAWVVFAALMTLKIALNTRLNHYGFLLAMPALMVLVALLVGWLPSFVSRRNGAGAVLASGSCAVLAGLTLFHVQLSNHMHALRAVEVGRGADTFLVTGRRGNDFAKLMELLEKNTNASHSVAVMPEGAMVNYLLRRKNPTRYTFFEPSDLIMFGEEKIVAAYAAAPPDFVVYVHVDSAIFGTRYFSKDYAKELHAWIEANYRPVANVGPPPFESEDGGMLVLKRIAPAPVTQTPGR